MKTIDLHTHTISTPSDYDFEFSLDALKRYVDNKKISIIGITNHNVFDIAQYHQISSAISALVLPGIEVDLENGHILILSDPTDVEDFSTRCHIVEKEIQNPKTTMRLTRFKEIFTDLSRYIIIPHYDKNPPIPENILNLLGSYVTCGEVASAKKFIYCKKNPEALVPALFSDCRFSSNAKDHPIRQTYVDINEPTFAALKYALSDRKKVYLSDDPSKDYFTANKEGLKISSGLNVIIGGRSSGKSYTLNSIASGQSDNEQLVKYIKQFSLVQSDDNDDLEQYNNSLRHKQSLVVQDYLKEFRAVVEDVLCLDFEADDRLLSNYAAQLIQHANEHAMTDAFSKAAMFSETAFAIDNLDALKKVIEATQVLIENLEYREIISNHINISSLHSLAVALINKLQQLKEEQLLKSFANDLIFSIKSELQRKTAATAIPDIDFYKILTSRLKRDKFCEVVNALRHERVIAQNNVQTFRVETRSCNFKGAGELKSFSGKQTAFSTAYKSYESPYKYLTELKSITAIESSELYKYFMRIECRVLNRFGFEVSGGERSEFRLLQEIQDAMKYDILLIDEPESSFDNIFLLSEVNELIRHTSQSMPVVLVTHNNTVGASIKPDYLIFTRRIIDSSDVKYITYSGHPADKYLQSSCGERYLSHDALMGCLEAGEKAYITRKESYEMLKN